MAKVEEASEGGAGWEHQALWGFTLLTPPVTQLHPGPLPLLQDKETRTRGQELPWWSSG